MKKLYTLVTFVVFGFLTTYAQVIGYAINGLQLPSTTSYYACDSNLTIGFSAQTPNTSSAATYDLPYTILGNNFAGFQFVAQVNWGDGSTSTSNGGTSTSGTNINMNPALSHNFSNPGTYLVTTTVYNSANQTYAIDTVEYHVGYCNVYFYFMVNLDCNNDGTAESQLTNVPFILSSTANTLNASTNSNGMVMLQNVLQGSYTIQISPTWLAANGYVVNNIIPNNNVYIYGGGASTYLATLNCVGTNPQGCLHGHVFCDANGNGIWDSNESGIPNAPVQINGTTAYTNSTGEYVITYPGGTSGYNAISVSNSWAQQHGYTIPANAPDSVLFTACTPGAASPILNFPINCGSSTNPGTINCYGGYVFCDANGNGVMNAGELPIAWAPVNIMTSTSANTSTIVYTDSTGYFEYCGPSVLPTPYVVASIASQWLVYNGYNPSTNYVTLVGSTTSIINNGYLAINCSSTPGCADMWTSVTPWIGYYQNSTAYIKLNWGSYGPNPAYNYTLSFTYPAGLILNPASIQNSNYTISGNTITWNLTNSMTSFSTYDVITFQVPAGLMSGTQHFFSSSIAPTGNYPDCATFNNAGNLLQIVGNSYDPNDKVGNTTYVGVEYPIGFLDASNLDAITYTIRFQNTGTAPAQNISIIDTLDANLDWSTFTLINSSHPVEVVQLGNGVLRFDFNQIWLADSSSNEAASHGELSYRITEQTGLAFGTEINNTAHIYFDWNSPIVTNTTQHINTQLEGLEEQQEPLHLYPNPAHDVLHLSSLNTGAIRITDVNGRVQFESQLAQNLDLDVKNWNSGIYFVEFGSQRSKFVKW
ncbi:MAG: hypothetical protein RLZZ301_873 [Bacteroidota bacterium]|jgi:uncharacterized repeat protein (TIGR01451 family)